MQEFIEHFSRSRRLVLAWEPPIHVRSRTRWAVGDLSATEEGFQFRYYSDAEFRSQNRDRSLAELKSAGYVGYPAFGLPDETKLFTRNVIEAFARRVPTSSRSDFGAYLSYFGISPDIRISPFQLLGATEARLPSDGFTLVDPFDVAQDSCDAVIEVVGHRHYPVEGILSPGDPLSFVAEPSNEFDKHAVQIWSQSACIGYVNRIQAPVVSSWIESRALSGTVARLNGNREKPRAYAMMHVRPLRHTIAA